MTDIKETGDFGAGSPVSGVLNTFENEATAVILRILLFLEGSRQASDETVDLSAILVLIDNICEPAVMVGLSLFFDVAKSLRNLLVQFAAGELPVESGVLNLVENTCLFLLGMIAVQDKDREANPAIDYLLARHARLARYQAPNPTAQTAPRPMGLGGHVIDSMSLIVHDLKAPFGIIKSTVSHLMELAIDDWSQRRTDESLERIARQAERGLSMASRILSEHEATSSQDSAKTWFKPTDLIERTISDLESRANELGVSIECFADPSLTMLADYLGLSRVLDNVMSNALKFSQPGGVITVACAPHITYSIRSGMKSALFKVTDRGRGIPPEMRPLIFLERFQVHGDDAAKGQGLGLLGAKKICEAHGGTIWIEPLEGGGTVVLFLIPWQE